MKLQLFVRKSTYDADIAREQGRTERIASKWAGAMEKLEKSDEKIDGLEIALKAATSELAKYKRGLSLGTQASAARRKQPQQAAH